MQIRYSPDADIVIIKLRDGTPSDSSDLCEGVIVHYNDAKAPIEIEILDASAVIDMTAVDVSLKEPLPQSS